MSIAGTSMLFAGAVVCALSVQPSYGQAPARPAQPPAAPAQAVDEEEARREVRRELRERW